MTEKTEYIEGIVSALNAIVREKTGPFPTSYAPFVLTSDGDQQAVTCFGIPFWNSEEDEREFNEEAGCYETLEDYLRREFNTFALTLDDVRL